MVVYVYIGTQHIISIIIYYTICIIIFLRNKCTPLHSQPRPREMWCKVNGSTALCIYKYNGARTHMHTRQVRGYTH